LEALVLGFLVEDRQLFQHHQEKPATHPDDTEDSSRRNRASNAGSTRQTPLAAKKTIPLYIGLAIGFCGSSKSFSSWMGDEFSALANHLRTPPMDHPTTASHNTSAYSTSSRSAGYSFMAVLAIGVITLTLSVASLKIGAHVAILIDPENVHISSRVRRFLGSVIMPLGYGSCIEVAIIASSPPQDSWREKAIFATVFAPLGCLLRFYASLKLNGIFVSFPIGTFAVNMIGTAIYGLAYDVQHAFESVAEGLIACQVWQGIMDGFCGVLTTVSTFATEIEGLRRLHAYTYGMARVMGGIGRPG
jgi:fluoride exporter